MSYLNLTLMHMMFKVHYKCRGNIVQRCHYDLLFPCIIQCCAKCIYDKSKSFVKYTDNCHQQLYNTWL